ncbi:MAG: preprotein translocase subunit SecG [Phycisphaerae bacterium]
MIMICSLLLIGLVLLQKNRGSGLSGAFGGAGGHSAFGTKTGDFLTWVTVGVTGAFLLLCVVGNYVFIPDFESAPTIGAAAPGLPSPNPATPTPPPVTPPPPPAGQPQTSPVGDADGAAGPGGAPATPAGNPAAAGQDDSPPPPGPSSDQPGSN